MLKPKNLREENGAAGLAEMMAGYTSGMDVVQVALGELRDAPQSWNFFRPLNGDKFLELCESIAENGLIHPVIAFENEEGEHVIISGHNRKRAYEKLLESTGDGQYSRIACVIKRDISEEEARSLLVDANWVQRSLAPSERAKAILYKYAHMGRKPRQEGGGARTYDLVAEHFGLKATQVYQYTRLATLPDEWLRQVDKGRLSIKAAVYLAGLDDEQRREVGLLCGNMPTTQLVSRWQKRQRGEQNLRRISRDVPEEIYNQLMDMIDEQVKEFYISETKGQRV